MSGALHGACMWSNLSLRSGIHFRGTPSLGKTSFLGSLFVSFHLGCVEVRHHQGPLSLAAMHREVELQSLVPLLVSGYLFYPKDSEDVA